MELTDYWKIIRAHWIEIIAFTVAGALLGFTWALLQPRVYTSDASGIVQAGVSQDVGSAIAGDTLARSLVRSYVDIASSRAVAEVAAKAINYDGDPANLVSRITVTNPTDTATMKISATANTPEGARDLAEAWVQAIGVQIAKVENSNATPGSETSIVTFVSLDSAQLPSSPSSPNTRLAVLIGFVLGLIAGLAYALLRNTFDRRVHSISQVEQATGKAVIGTIPFHSSFSSENRIVASKGSNDQSSTSAEEYAVAEAVRELRTNLQFMDVDNPPRVMVITSALPGEGKSTAAANLANAIAAGGQNVVVVDGDLRRPMVAKTFDVLPGIGLTDVLVGRAEISDVLQPWGDTGRLWVMGAGKIPPNPSELLGSNSMRKVLDELSSKAIVLVDAPPLLPVTDAAILTARTDGAIVVSYARRTTIDALQEALNNLERVKGRALGVIINGVPRKGARSDGYGYRYRSYSYYGRKDESTEAPSPEEPALQDDPADWAHVEEAAPRRAAGF